MEGPRKRWFLRADGAPSSLLGSSFDVGAGVAAGGGAGLTQAGGAGEETEAGAPEQGIAQGAPERSVLSRKELARELRRQAYRRAKQARAEDPRHLAMKEAAKLRRREQYQHVKAQRKEREAEQKTKQKLAAAAAQAEAKRQLAERVKSAIGRGSEPGRALARDIERALECAEVRELMDRLRSESAALAAQHRGEPAGS